MKINKIILLFLFIVSQVTYATPSNEELFNMLVDVKKEQERLSTELKLSKQRESDLAGELERTKQELKLAKDDSKQNVVAEKKGTVIEQGFKLSAGLLYQKPLVSSSVPGNGISDYAPGFQVSAAYQAQDNLDFSLKYKRLDSRFEETLSRPIISSFPGLSSVGTDSYDVKYNSLDFEIGKTFDIADTALLRLSGGARYISLSQSFMREIQVTSSVLGPVASIRWGQGEDNIWAVGPRITATPIWKPLGRNFRIVGNFAVSSLIGSKPNSQDKSADNFYTIIETGAGLGYALNTDLLNIDMEAGYQLENWVNHNSELEGMQFEGMHGPYGTVGVKF